LQVPFTVDKKGPSQPVLTGQRFNYGITVSFQGAARGVTVVDLLPTPFVLAASAASTWFSSKTNTSTRK
jgi:hypothetical protein